MADEDKVTSVTGETISRSDIVQMNIAFYEDAYSKKLTDICDFSEGSEIRTLHESIAIDIMSLYRELYRMHKMKFINYASGSYLDELGCEFHLSRKGSEVAHGQVTFSLDSISPTDIEIPQGTVIVQRNTGYEYVLQENCVIAQGAISTTGNVYSKITGSKYNCSANTLTAFLNHTMISSKVKVTNPDAITGGVDAETDDEFRKRIKNAKRERAYGTVTTYQNLIREHVTDVHDVQFVDPVMMKNGLLKGSKYPEHYQPGKSREIEEEDRKKDPGIKQYDYICTDCTSVIFVNANSKPCPSEVIDDVDYLMTQQNNLVVGHKFHIEKAQPVPLYLAIHIYYDSPVNEETLADHIEAFMDGNEITTKNGLTRYEGLNIKETLYKSALIDAIEAIPGVHHVESLQRLRYDPDAGAKNESFWNETETGYVFVDSDDYVYRKESLEETDYWGKKNFNQIDLASGKVFCLGSKRELDPECDTIFELKQTKHEGT